MMFRLSAIVYESDGAAFSFGYASAWMLVVMFHINQPLSWLATVVMNMKRSNSSAASE
jgi:uncharacterized membrane protein YciS (DUF1049 family)